MTTTKIEIISEGVETIVKVDGVTKLSVSTDTLNLMNFEAINSAFGSVMALMFSEHVINHGRSNNG